VSKELDAATKAAIDAALASMPKLAEEADLHPTTVARWRAGLAGVGPDSAAKFANVLKARALGLLERAAELEAIAEQEKGEQ
jgi:hypothetical protein